MAASVPIDRAGVTLGYAQTRKGQIHYAEAGTGRPLLLLSATPRTHRCYLRLMSLLAPSCRAIAIDMPGFGNSHGLPKPLSVESLASCVNDFLDAMELPQVDVFGLHTGNKLAAALAANWPKRLRRLIIAGQSHSIIPEAAARNAAIQPWFDKYKTYFEPSSDGSHLVREWLSAHATTQTIWWPSRLLNAPTILPSDVENAEARVIDFVQGWHSCVPVYEAIFAFDLAHAYGRIVCPTLVLELQTAAEAHIGGQADRVCALIRNSTSASLVETDGLGLEMRPADFAAPILSFLSEEAAAMA